MSEGETNGAVLAEIDTESLVINACYIQGHRSWIVLPLRQGHAVAKHACVETDSKDVNASSL